MRRMLSIAPLALAGALSAAVALAGCATAPQISRGSANYIQKGMSGARFKGNEFYMAVGETDLYSYGMFGDLSPSGKTVEIAVAIQADKDTGEVLRIATLQPKGSASPALTDLRGGISIIDLQGYPRWLDAIDAMRDAIVKLGTYTTFTSSGEAQLAPVVAVVGVDFGWNWGWGGYRYPRYPYPRHYRRWR